MDFTTILNRKNSAAAAAAAEAQLHQQYLQTQMNQHSPTMKAEPGAPDNTVNVYPPHPSVPMDSGLAESFYYAQASGSAPRNMAYVPGGYAGEAQLQQAPVATGSVSAEAPPKTFHCSTCNKGFARRSDLARHGRFPPFFPLPYGDRSNADIFFSATERIHTGIRPHACDWPGCGKQFIQRSALTVHSRVHTGEKPHMCERCGKVCVIKL